MNPYRFENQNREIVLSRYNMPTPWMNYLSNGTLHAMLSQAGGGVAWYKSPQIWRINHYRFFHLPTDRSGFYTYIKDGDAVWCPTNEPCACKPEKWEAAHGMGYTRFSAERDGLHAEATYLVSPLKNVMLWHLELRSDRDRNVTVYPYVELGMMEFMRELQWQCYNKHQLSVYEKDGVLIYRYGVENQPKPDATPLVYFASDAPAAGFDCDRDAFIGSYRSEEAPIGLEHEHLKNSTLFGGDPCFALELPLTLRAGEAKSVNIYLGTEMTESEISKSLAACKAPDFFAASMQKLAETWEDFFCYPMWYNGHGIDIGRLHRGYWLPVKPGWYYGCGEYGAEGLDSAEVMEECYPREWMREPFDPGHIVRSQTKSFSGFFYDAQEDMQGWISRSQRYQAFAARMMTEAFRRDDRMVSNAIHLFIDAWPSGWMKSIMDCKRIPKQAYFAYRDALAPLLVSLRTDRFAYTAGETIQIEAFLCNDTAKSGAYTLAFELYNEQNKLIQTGRVPAHADACRAVYVASAEFPAETAQDRETLTLRAVLLDGNGDVVNDTEQKLTVFQDVTVVPNDNVVILKLEPGLHTVAGETVTVKPCGMLPLHFVSRKTGHPAVDEFKEQDFSYWYDAKEDCITPLLDTTFTAEGFTPILLSNNMDEQGNWGPVLAAAEKLYEGKHYVICQLDLRQENPVAKLFLRNLYRLGTK
mgnify:CR=1 FL=1